MKNLVLKCYDYHKQPFLLKYSKDLSVYDTANFRYVRDSDTTTALWSRDPKKLLLTFRNELMVSLTCFAIDMKALQKLKFIRRENLVK